MLSKTERMHFASCVDESCNIITNDHLEEKELFVDVFIFLKGGTFMDMSKLSFKSLHLYFTRVTTCRTRMSHIHLVSISNEVVVIIITRIMIIIVFIHHPQAGSHNTRVALHTWQHNFIKNN